MELRDVRTWVHGGELFPVSPKLHFISHNLENINFSCFVKLCGLFKHKMYG